VGIRLNREPPNIYLKVKKAGGVKVTFPNQPKNLDEKMVYNILKDYKMLNAEVLVRDENGIFAFRTVSKELQTNTHALAQQPSTTSST